MLLLLFVIRLREGINFKSQRKLCVRNKAHNNFLKQTAVQLLD